jgi:hypothetical protein
MPFVWLGWGLALALLAGAWYLKTGLARVVMFNAAVLLAMFAMAETYVALYDEGFPTYSAPYALDDDVLGTVPVKQVRAHSSRIEHGKVVYDVNYTIDANGLRIAPASQVDSPAGSVLFFGCSFTFGEGVQDDETVPYQVAIQSNGRYETYNFGFHGYGPHQMLAAIESGRVRQIVTKSPRYAFYEALPDHVARVAGKIPYGRHNPRYRLNPDGTVRLDGHFDDGQKPPSAFELRLRGQLRKSAIYRMFERAEPRTNEDDLRLLLATVRRSRDLLAAEYPGIEFHVVLWRNFEYEQPIYQKLQEGFAEMHIPVHLVENMLPDYNLDSRKYLLSPGDGHPNQLANRLLARYIVSEILSPNPEVPSPPRDDRGTARKRDEIPTSLTSH